MLYTYSLSYHGTYDMVMVSLQPYLKNTKIKIIAIWHLCCHS